MHNIHFDFTIDTLTAVIIFNVIGTALQVLLKWLHDKKKYQWSDGPMKAINFLMTMVALAIANKSHPLTSPESSDKK